MNPNHRAHIQSAAYLVLGAGAVATDWVMPPAVFWWQQLGLEPNIWWQWAALTVMAGAMLIKVRRPTSALVLGGLIIAGATTIGLSLGLLVCLTDLIYSHGIRAAPRRAKIGERTLVGTAPALVIITAVTADAGAVLNMLVLSAAVLLVPAWWAREVRRGYPAFVEDRVRQRLAEERHADLLAEQEARRAQALESERRRMARELHDVVSSQVASIALTSGAVLNAEPEIERDRRALQTIRTTSVEALDELRQMVTMLRSQGLDDAADLLTDTTWDEVLARAEAQNLDIEVHGSPPEGLPEAVRGVLLRILQESLTNARRHGDGTARVYLRTARGRLILRIESGLGAAHPPNAEPGGGTGLSVMEERARAVGGSVRTGEQSGQWQVAAELPCPEVKHEPV